MGTISISSKSNSELLSLPASGSLLALAETLFDIARESEVDEGSQVHDVYMEEACVACKRRNILCYAFELCDEIPTVSATGQFQC